MRKEEGQDLVEFALIAPLLFLLLFGIVEFGVAVWHYNTLSNAVREGARAALVLEVEDRQTEATETALAFARDLGLPEASLSADYSHGERNGVPTVSVTLTYTYTGITGLSALAGEIVMTAHSTMLAEQPGL